MITRRRFLGAGLAASVAAGGGLFAAGPAQASVPGARPLSYAARQGLLPNVPLVTHRGEPVRFYDDLVRERTILINFFVVQCTEGRCPTANANLRKVQEMLGPRMGRDVFFYSITLQPELDTVPILREYAEDIFEAGPGWLFLTGRPADVETLRRAQGFYDPDPERDRNPALHSSSARVGSDLKQRWSMVALATSPRNIYTSIVTL